MRRGGNNKGLDICVGKGRKSPFEKFRKMRKWGAALGWNIYRE